MLYIKYTEKKFLRKIKLNYHSVLTNTASATYYARRNLKA